MLTDDQLKYAARELCRLRGIDPERLIPHGAEPDENGLVLAVLLHSPAWMFYKREIEAHEQVDDAIRIARERVHAHEFEDQLAKDGQFGICACGAVALGGPLAVTGEIIEQEK